jgi:hypothetical protein
MLPVPTNPWSVIQPALKRGFLCTIRRLLNTPFCGSEITPTDPQGILFSWTPLHMASPLSGSTEYEFELFEIRPNEGDPNVVVNSTLPIFSQTTTSTFLNYGIIEPPLQAGMSYVWRVKAKDPSLRNLYRNNGYSAVCTFTYGSIAGSLIAGHRFRVKFKRHRRSARLNVVERFRFI